MNNLGVTEQEDLAYIETEVWAKRYKALEQLHKNKDFQTLILEGFFRDRAVDGVSLLAHQHTIDSGTRGQIMEQLVAISHLQDYFRVVVNQGAPAAYDEELDEATDSNVL